MKFNFVLAISFLSLTVACSKTASDGAESSSNVSESAMSEAGAQSSASEGASSPGLMAVEMAEDFQSMDYVDPQDSNLHTLSACTFSSARTNCTSNVDTLDWNGCTVGSVAQLSGGWTETWSAGFCGDGTKPNALTNGASVTRVSPNGETLTVTSGILSGASVTTNTVAHSAYDGTSLPATGITTSMAGGTRTVVINGLHRTMKGPHGSTWFDHSLKSTGLTVSGTRALGTRVVNGNLTLYHNLAKYTAAHAFNSVTWGSAACCYPTSGNITTTLSGSSTGTVRLDFGSTCGQATFTDATGSTSTVTLNQCR